MVNISIITPSYNQGKFIERTIKSVLDQNISELEYIIIDGKSADETLSIVERYRAQLLFTSESDSGQSQAINKGLALCKGDIIGWLNSDDIYYSRAISKVCDFFANHPHIDIVYGQAYHIDEQDNILGLYPTMSWNFNELKQSCYIVQPAVFFRRSVFTRYGKLDESLNFCMDYEYWIRLGKANASIAYLPEVLAGTRSHSLTKTENQARAMKLEVINMLKKHYDVVPARWFLTYAYTVLQTEGKFNRYNPFCLILLYVIAAKVAIQHNGKYRGMVSILQFPQVFIRLSYHQWKRSKKNCHKKCK